MQLMMACAVQQELELTGGLSETVLPRVEEWLQQSSDHQRALSHLGNGRLSGRYHSTIDALFCKTFPEWESSAQAFYADKGPPLRDLASPAELDIYQYALIRVLEVAYDLMCQKRRASWGWVVKEASDPIVNKLRALGPPPRVG